jgi:hypothetical protein
MERKRGTVDGGESPMPIGINLVAASTLAIGGRIAKINGGVTGCESASTRISVELLHAAVWQQW